MRADQANSEDRVLVVNHGRAPRETISAAMVAGVALARRLGKREVTVVMPARTSFDEKVFTGVLTPQQCSRLSKKEKVPFYEEIILTAETPKTISNSAEVVVCLYLDAQDRASSESNP